MDALVGLVVWAVVLYFVYKLVKTMLARMRGNTSANAAADSESQAGAHADVGGIHIHLHIGDGISLSRSDDEPGSNPVTVVPAEWLRNAVESARGNVLPDSPRLGELEGRNTRRLGATARRGRNNDHATAVEIAE